jgi:protein-tyrosine phosphatase
MKILMVCLGNMFRSPMAAGILKDKLHKKNIENVEVDSAGFESHNINQPADPRATELMKKNGIDISDHVMRMFSANDFEIYDKIYVMDSGAYRDTTYFARNEKDIKKIEFLTNIIYPDKYQAVPDPNNCTSGTLVKVYQLLDKVCESLANKIEESQSNKN